MLKAVTRQASLVDSKIAQINSTNLSTGKSKISTAYFFDHFATDEDVAVMVTEEDFMNAERELVPSVSMKELEHYGKVRAMFEKVEKDDSSSVLKNGKGKEKVADGIDGEDARPKSNGKGKGKEKVVDRKGKGKEKSVGRWDEGSDDEHDERTNGHGAGGGKGKGKAVDMGFQQGREEDDEELY